MEKIKETSQIIEEILDYYRINSRNFAEKIGTSPTQIYDLQKKKIQKLSPAMIEKIVAAYPEIQRVYLMTGEGDMLRPGAIQHNNGNQNCTITNVDNSTSSSEEISELRSQLKDANETIHALTSMLSNKMSELQSSVDIINKMLSGEE